MTLSIITLAIALISLGYVLWVGKIVASSYDGVKRELERRTNELLDAQYRIGELQKELESVRPNSLERIPRPRYAKRELG